MGQVASGSLMFTTNELIVIAGLLVVAYLLMGWVGVVLVVVAVWVWDKNRIRPVVRHHSPSDRTNRS